jgi:folate-binding protein YgfZ
VDTTGTADYVAARSRVALFNRSQRGQVELAGAEAVQFLHNLCTNDIAKLPPRHGCEIFLCNNKARIIGHGFAHRLLAEPPTLVLDLDPGSGAKVAAHLNHFIVSEQVEVVDRAGTVAQWHMAGPQAVAVLARVVTTPLEALSDLQHLIDGDLRVVRHDLLHLPGFDLVVPASQSEALRDRLVQAGAVIGTADTFDILRVEAGVPVDGIDMDAERFVVEVGRSAQAISYTKGCYLGQEPIVMARDRGHANRTLLGLEIEGPEPAAAAAKVTCDDQEVGQVTSSVMSPRIGSAIALAYIKRGSQEPGTAVSVRGRRAVVASLPFEAGERGAQAP